MDKIASPQDLQTELKQIIAYASSAKPERTLLASKLRSLADKVAGQKIASTPQDAFEYDLVPKALKPILKEALTKLDTLVKATRKGTWPSTKVEQAVMRHRPSEMPEKEFISAVHKAYAAWSRPLRDMAKK